MGLHKWIYQGKVKKHLVEVNHSPESGKLMIKLNGEMMLYDYGVFDADKNYFLIIDGILCSVNVFRNKNTYRYDFVEESFAQGNRVIGSLHFKQKKRLYYFAGGLAFIFLLLFLVPFFLTGSSGSGKQLLSETGIPATAQVIFIGPELSDELKIYYSYHVNGEFVLSYFIAPLSGERIYYTPDGFPLETGDKFQVRYSKNNVRDHIFQIENPATEQVDHYKSMVSDQFLHRNGDLEVTKQQLTDYSNCVTEAVYNIYGISGLSAFYLNINGLKEGNSRISEYKNMLHNTTFVTEELNCRREYLFSKKL